MTAKIKTQKAYSGYKHPHKPRGVSHHSFHKVYWPYIPLVAIMVVLLGLTFRSGAFKKGPEVLGTSNIMSIDKLAADTNNERLANSLPPLNINPSLDSAAQAKASDMASRDYWSHNTPDGGTPWQFVDAVHYSYQKVGENLAAGFADEASSVAGWMASPSHRLNMLDPLYTDVGFGTAMSQDYKAAGGGPMAVVVAFYGRPAQAGNIPQTLAASLSSSKITSHAQLALAGYKIANYATAAALGIFIGALFVWASRHLMAVRRVVAKGEAYAIKHPLIDISLLIIAALAYILSRTAGFVK